MRAVLLALLLCLSASPTLAGEPVVIGVVYNLSGSMASIDAPGLEGMKLAVARINREGGVLGRTLALEVRDGGSDPERCRAAARELAGLGVAAMAGLNDSDFALAAGEQSTLARIPFVTAGATLPGLPRILGSYFFMACFGDDAQAKAMAKYVLRRQGGGAMLLLENKDSFFAGTLARAFAKAYGKRGGTVAAREAFSPGGPQELGADARGCISSGACKGVFVAGVPQDAVPSVTALRAAGYDGPMYSGDGFDTPLLAELGGKASPGVYYSTHVSFDNPRPQVRAFVAAWEAAHGARPESGFAALGYDAVGLIADAVARAGSAEPSRVRAALAATRGYQGATGDISYPSPLAPPLKPVVIERFDKGARTFEAEVRP